MHNYLRVKLNVIQRLLDSLHTTCQTNRQDKCQNDFYKYRVQLKTYILHIKNYTIQIRFYTIQMNIFTTQMEKNQILQSLTCHILFIPSQNVIWCNVILMSEKLLLMTYIYYTQI